MTLHFHQPFKHGRIIAQLSEVEIGVIQPDFRWRLHVGSIEGTARTELAAKSALSHALRDWMLRAGLTEAT